ncbi:1,2-phenylacetyl-CoA epoxidase subunit PaaE [Streptomyces tsukubensis]|uniref:Phenylacetic acid degradation protein n=1 Tax=Streptomyces tsukubensis TaxID=83656 RepID=A0A1V4AG44_9ACTN|nr:1,2-phenylacetyl-CoA epoxidase subunit PaaE [Streptomyces tsukubensis]OON82635.1 phenylacetic acid degradation protein [Streptomyces tsukubensis]QFR92193.1 phenylacetate-CoA oxygenase/reductase subunit PaaK [Streptomyces tsukubensis]
MTAPTPTASTQAVRGRRRPAFHALRVASVEALTEDAAAVTFAVPGALAERFAFAPGQSLTVRRRVDGHEQRRSYSLCSPVGQAPRIGVRVVPDGLFSNWLVREVRPGDVVDVMEPTGLFTPVLGEPAHHVLVAAGSGITPMLSIAGSVLAACEEARVTLLYGNRRSGTVMFADELADLKDGCPERFQVAHVLSREPREAEILSGRLDGERLAALVSAFVDAGEEHHWWLCGPHGMVKDARALLEGLGVPADRIHQELFFADDQEPVPLRRPDDTVPEGPASEVTVVLDGRSSTFPLARDESVLDGAQRVRPDMPFACKGGVCGTCRARVTGGEADMRRNFALEPGEVEQGYVLTCQTRAVSEELTVDYDV